jgi:transcriptional regulator with XRE-family HTH domain
MIAISAGQAAAGAPPGLAREAAVSIAEAFAPSLVLPVDHSPGGLRVLVAGGAAAVAITLDLTRSGWWAVGLGAGGMRRPLGTSIPQSTGDVLLAAGTALARAHKRPTRFAADSLPTIDLARDLESLLDLVLQLRSRRTEQGWQVSDLVATGLTQAEAAERLGITPQSASKRARAADLKTEAAALPSLARLVDTLDREASPPSEHAAHRAVSLLPQGLRYQGPGW